MINKGFSAIEEQDDFPTVTPGGYVVRIVDVVDHPDKEYLDVVWDICEGALSGYYSDAWGVAHPYAHHTIRSYKDSALGMFKAFLTRLEESNGGMFSAKDWEMRGCDEREFVGLEMGVILQTEVYNGKPRLQVFNVIASQDVRNGDFKMPEPREAKAQQRKQQPTMQPAMKSAQTAQVQKVQQQVSQAQPITMPLQSGQVVNNGGAYGEEIPF